MKIKKELFEYAYLGFFVVFLFMFFSGALASTTGLQLVVIENSDPNSMYPTYFQGDQFLIRKVDPQDINLGDIVVYSKNGGVNVIHRVVDIQVVNGNYHYRVKGDNAISNGYPDLARSDSLINYDEVLGKVIYRIPYMGHIALAMQRNGGIQFFVYFLAIIFAIGIVFWPENEDDTEDEFWELSSESWHQFITNVKTFPGTVASKIKQLSKRKSSIIFALLLIIIITAPSLVPAMLEDKTNSTQTGVLVIELDNYDDLSSTRGGVAARVIFFQVKVTLYDAGTLFLRIQGFTLEAYSPSGEKISSSEWNILRTFKGEITVGGSIVIPYDQRLTDGDTMDIIVKLHLKKLLTIEDRDFYFTAIYRTN
ncbi:MAG: signal peptidase I [Candidatus Heimdallarchaeota archaeon]|nr:signal peptidase I [Candidatus Heimdallarchaeota archaeon]